MFLFLLHCSNPFIHNTNLKSPKIRADTIEKIYCDRDNSNDALYALLSQKNQSDPMALAAALNGGANNWNNNPFIYLVWMMFANRMWGNNREGLQDSEIQNQLSAIRTQMQDNQNSNLIMDAVKGVDAAINQLAGNLNCDFKALQGAICDVRQGIALLAGKSDSNAEKIINAVLMGNLQLTQALKDCCCQTQQSILKMGYENQLGQKDIINAMQTGFDRTNTGIERGFSSVAFQAQQDKCDIIRASQDNTRLIIDTLNNHWNNDLQLRLNRAELELSQQRQNAALIAALKTTTTTTA